MIKSELLDEEVINKTYVASKEDQDILKFVNARRDSMKNYREQIKVEKDWKDADNEYIPHELDMGEARKRFEQDQDSGLRSRMVKIGGDEDMWRSNNSNPTLLVKIQTAISQIIDNDPEAMLVPMSKLYDGRTTLANSIWKRNWTISNSKENLKLFVFNLFKYGWAIGRSFPKIIKYNKEVLVEVDNENPENNVYESKELVWFNDIAKQNLDPYRTWIDESSKPYDIYSTNDCYFEMDYSYDEAKVEFGMYSNWEFVPKSAFTLPDKEEEKGKTANDRKDIVTIGFYQNRVKDLYVIMIPSNGIVLHKCPLPNDDGLLDIWHSMLMLRSSTSPYGISLWTILKQDKAMYDKWDNMTSDQLTLSIMKFGFYTGTASVIGDGVMKIVPGMAKQVINGKVEWMEIPGPGADAYEGLKDREARMSSNTGISPTLEGDITGKTLGEIQLARESSLKRLKTPLENIAWAIEQDAYLTLSWAKQVYSTPEIKQFATEEEMTAYEEEYGLTNGGTTTEETEPDEYGLTETKSITAQYYPELALHLEDRDGTLMESKESKFFQIGKDIPAKELNWRGVFKVIPKSLVGDSQIILQQTKMEMYNLLTPLFAQDPTLYKKAAIQICKINDEDEKDWLPDSWLVEAQPEEEMTPEEQNAQQPMMIDPNGNPADMTMDQTGAQMQPQQPPQQNNVGGGTFQAQAGLTPPQNENAPSVIPQQQLGGVVSKMFK